MLITPNNSYVYVSLGSLGVQVLTLGSGGALSTGTAATYLSPLSTSTSPADYGLASNPTSTFLFVAEINTGLRVFSIGTAGALNEVSGSPYAVGTGPTGLLVDPTGSYVYVANKGSNNISEFTLTAASGKLTAVAGSPFSSGGLLPIAMVNDNTKQYVAVINSGSNTARVTAICNSLNSTPPPTESWIPSRQRLRAPIRRLRRALRPRTRSNLIQRKLHALGKVHSAVSRAR